jgi:hypothetical protein
MLTRTAHVPLAACVVVLQVAAASPKRLVGLDAKLKLLAAEVVGLQDQAALAAHVQVCCARIAAWPTVPA